MNLTGEQVRSLLEMLTLTRDSEADCNDCLSQMAEFAEVALEGRSIPQGLKCIEEHLDRCGECREEFEALKTALDGGVAAP